TLEIVQFVNIFTPHDGTYSISIKGTTTEPYSVQAEPFASDGSQKAKTQIMGTAQPGGVVPHELSFKSVPTPWQNSLLPLDVDASELVAPLDAILIINQLNFSGSGPLTVPRPAADANKPFYDTSGDNFLAPLDAINVINYLNSRSS